jgi:hypothetical protein
MISPGDDILYSEGFESIDQLPNVVVGLRKRGWTRTEIRKLLGDNWARAYTTAWAPKRARSDALCGHSAGARICVGSL